MESSNGEKDGTEALNSSSSETNDKEGELGENTSPRKTEEQQQRTMENTDEGLGDDENLLDRLGDIDLTEEDTEMLLEEAYAVNRKLKEILKQQEKEGSASADMIRRISNPKQVKSKHSVLPPIRKKTTSSKQNEIYSARIPRAHQSTASVDISKAKSATNRKLASSAHSSSSGKKSKGPKSASSSSSHSGGESPQRPSWNERFSYT